MVPDPIIQRLQRLMDQGNTAAAALPLLQELADSGRFIDIPRTIAAAVGMMEINKWVGARYLANHVPALVFRSLTKNPSDCFKILACIAADGRWEEQIRQCALENNGEDLQRTIDAMLKLAENP